MEKRVISTQLQEEDYKIESSLRPQRLEDYIGQEKIKSNMKVYIEAAKARQESLDHVLFYGPPGLGKTTLAGIIANEMGTHLKVTSGPAIAKPGEMAAILNNLAEGDILFVDEIHRLNRQVEEVLYPAMEDYVIDVMIGKGESARSIRLNLPKFTLVGATTRAGMLSAPLRDRFGVVSHMVLAKSSLSEKDSMNMIDEIKKVDGVKLAASMDSLTGPMVPQDVIPDDVKEIFKSGDYQMMVIVSEYASATDEVNKQCDEINAIIKKYDNTAMLIGEAPCTKDLIEITDVDFKNVSIISIAAIFIIILLTFKSISLPIILVCVIEFAIFINMGIPAYTGTVLPFIASIVIGTIQLGATVDYAILMTNKYKKNRFRGMDKKEAITDALSKSIQSIIVSALSFFAATFGVGLYSNIDMIGSLCMLMARGAIISMIVVIFILPSMFMVFDRVICASSAGFRNKIK